MSARREAMLGEMGLGPLWKLRRSASEPHAEAETVPRPDTEDSAPQVPAPAEILSTTEPVAPQPVSPTGADDRVARIAAMDWPELQQTVADCRACRLCERRKQAVLGVGDRQADWLFVGEGPGADEDERGEPFVGQAGKLLDNMLAAIGLQRGKDVYIANTVKCRPPGNRTPEADEMAACLPFLARQIDLLNPRLIVALGRPAAQTLTGSEVKIAAVRGRLFEHRSIPLLITYHPAYLLRNLPDKAKAWEDLCFARASMANIRGEDG
ncbi:MAG: uracil-DNA glycosylase [Rhodocyclaceae bacterium]